MQLDQIFAKDIQRPIEGVIKADDAAHLGTEVDEYVLTNEAAKGLEILLEEYTSYTNANGVWISGFFGSGKSHMLKMLAHLLGDVEGQDYPRQSVSDSFRAKTVDAFLPGLLNKADRIPGKSLLFNIDQKAPLIAKDQTDALLKVFVKVFDESRGYFGNDGATSRAWSEDLDQRGQYDAFKAAFVKRIAGIDVERRDESRRALEGHKHRQERSPTSTAETNRRNHRGSTRSLVFAVSIEDFADVREGVDRQTGRPGFPAQFLRRRGRPVHRLRRREAHAQPSDHRRVPQHEVQADSSWVFVTSQEDMDKVIGDRTRQQGNDFSKIQARFKIAKPEAHQCRTWRRSSASASLRRTTQA